MSKPQTPNPVHRTFSSDSSKPSGSTAQSFPHPEHVSSKTFHIAGILTTVFGLDELNNASSLSCLWLLHPRLQTQSCMAPFAAAHIHAWNSHRKQAQRLASHPKNKSTGKAKDKGLLCISFDQRNHGSRLVSPQANEAWRSGNPTHAQDMFSIYHGTAADLSLLISYLPAYLPDLSAPIAQNIVLGISLGGHAAWQVVLREPRVSAAVVVIGCPDYEALMRDRARLSRLESYTKDNGESFVGSADYPEALMGMVRNWDPAGVLFGTVAEAGAQGQEGKGKRSGKEADVPVTDDVRDALSPVFARTLADKRVQCLSGGADKLVPYAMGEPFLRWLKQEISPGGAFEGSGVVLEDLVFEGVGHDVPPSMVGEMLKFVNETLDEKEVERPVRTERIQQDGKRRDSHI